MKALDGAPITEQQVVNEAGRGAGDVGGDSCRMQKPHWLRLQHLDTNRELTLALSCLYV